MAFLELRPSLLAVLPKQISGCSELPFAAKQSSAKPEKNQNTHH